MLSGCDVWLTLGIMHAPSVVFHGLFQQFNADGACAIENV